MTIHTARSTAPDAQQAAVELKQQLGSEAPGLLLFFAAPRFDANSLAQAMHALYDGQATTLGCTTAGELVSGAMLDGGITAMAIPPNVGGTVRLTVLDKLGDDAAIDAALDALEAELGQPLNALPLDRFVGFVLHDGLSLAEERVMERIGSRTNVPVVGGSAGDDLQFAETYVFLNGRAVQGASVLALLEPARRFTVLKTQSFDVLEPTLTVTKADPATRTVLEFNGKPAAQAYAEALGVTVEELPNRFMSNPLGLMVSETEPFVRSPMKLDGNNVVFYCNVQEGMALRVLQSRNIVADTERDLQALLAGLDGPAHGIVNFHCILRTLELKERGQCDAYGALFRDVPTVGFSTYGESYIGHINQTSTMVVFYG